MKVQRPCLGPLMEEQVLGFRYSIFFWDLMTSIFSLISWGRLQGWSHQLCGVGLCLASVHLLISLIRKGCCLFCVVGSGDRLTQDADQGQREEKLFYTNKTVWGLNLASSIKSLEFGHFPSPPSFFFFSLSISCLKAGRIFPQFIVSHSFWIFKNL